MTEQHHVRAAADPERNERATGMTAFVTIAKTC